MVGLKTFAIKFNSNCGSVPLGRWSLVEGSVKTTESSSMSSSSSFLLNTKYWYFWDCSAFSARSLSFCAFSLRYICRLSSVFFHLSFTSFLLFSLSFFIISRVACLGPVQDEMSFSFIAFFRGFSCAFVCVCFFIFCDSFVCLGTFVLGLCCFIASARFYCTCISFCFVKLFVLFSCF